MKKIDKNKIIDLLKEATAVFIHQEKLIIDINLKRIIIYNVKNKIYYFNLYKNNIEKKL